MTWVKLDDKFATHPKVTRLSDAAFRLHVLALCYSAAYLTDGRMTRAQVVGLAAFLDPKDTQGRRNGDGHPDAQATQAARELVASGVWELDGQVTVIHDYLRYNPSREQVLADRAAARERWELRGKQRRSFGGSFPEAESASPSPSRPGRKDKSSALARNSASPEAHVQEVQEGRRIRLRFAPASPEAPPPPDEPPDGDDSPDDHSEP